MALFVQQNENRTKLQERLEAELREKAKQRAQLAERPDGVEDARYLDGTKQTTSLAWVWVALFFAALAVFLYFAFGS